MLLFYTRKQFSLNIKKNIYHIEVSLGCFWIEWLNLISGGKSCVSIRAVSFGQKAKKASALVSSRFHVGWATAVARVLNGRLFHDSSPLQKFSFDRHHLLVSAFRNPRYCCCKLNRWDRTSEIIIPCENKGLRDKKKKKPHQGQQPLCNSSYTSHSGSTRSGKVYH